MATLEKPKIKKKKKTKHVANDEIAENVSCSSSANNVVNIEFPTTSTKFDQLISHECMVSAEFQSLSVDDDEEDESETGVPFEEVFRLPTGVETAPLDLKSELQDAESSPIEDLDMKIVLNEVSNAPVADEEGLLDLKDSSKETESSSTDVVEVDTHSLELKTEVETIVADENRPTTPQPWTQSFESPSAPAFEESSSTTTYLAPAYTFQPIAQYPDLASLRQTETKADVIYQTRTETGDRSQTKPLTCEQLRGIYSCRDIEMVKQFEVEFLMNSMQSTFENDALHKLLTQYSLLRSKLKMNLIDLANHKKRIADLETKIWTEEEETVKFGGICGDNVTVYSSEVYKIAVVNGKYLELTALTLSQVYELISFTYTSNLVNSEVIKSKIEQIIREIVSYSAFATITNESQVLLNTTLDHETLRCVSHLRTAISVLFTFIRKPTPDKQFYADLKMWLNTLIGLHLRIATREDHWFILFQILRCPSGVASWATSFLQVPLIRSNDSNFTDIVEVNHCVAIMHILLLPIKERREFLKAFTQSHKEISDPVKEELWILVDSDGEEGSTASGECVGLKESDLIGLLDQIPFDMLFGSALNVLHTTEDIIIESDFISANKLLKVIAFSSTLIELFGNGLLTYNTERYKQFAKRLGRLIRHVLQYVSDYQELFIRNNLSKDPYLCERINVELNSLVIKACSYIHRTRNLGTWQYFSSLPFANLDIGTVWQLFLYLNVGFPTEFPAPFEDYEKRFHSPDFWNRFQDANEDSSPEDLYYLLQTFFEIANERDKVRDWELIKTVSLHIFNVGFINESTRDICYKTSRDMLLNLSLSYQDLMSSLLLQLKIRFNEVENAIYLFKSLPLENWKPKMDNFEILSNWLLNFHYDSKENIVARIIISHLNWGFDCDGRLYLPHNIHVRMACLISDALTKYAAEVIGSSGLSESVRQVSSLIDSQTTKEQFVTWCWSMVSLLRLHLMDQSTDSVKKTLQNPTEPLMFVPDLERIDSIFQGVTENRPLAIYISLLASLWGHSIPLICQKGFEQLKLLLNDYRHAVVIRCIQLVTPLFLDCPETLGQCESFQNVLVTILNSDRTYLKMAKDLLYANSVGPVLELLNNMIHCQIIGYTDFGLPSPMLFTNLWLETLTCIPNWQNTSVVFLIDNILKVAYQFPDAWYSSKEVLRNYYKDCEDWKKDKTSTLKMFLGSSGTQTKIPILAPSQGWFALLLLEIEYESKEIQLWPEFLRQIGSSSGKGNLESILKKTTSIIGCTSFNPQYLVIYKYAHLVASMEVNHPLYPLHCQKFFSFYLARVMLHYDEQRFQHTYGVSDKFYEHNISLMKKIKTNLKTAEDYYKEQAGNHSDDECMTHFYKECSRLMKTFVLWLEETNINKISKNQNIDLPPQYNTHKLNEIFIGNEQHWTEFIHFPTIRDEQKLCATRWLKKSLRSQSATKRLRDPLPSKQKSTAIERIRSHLKSYDKRLPPPKLVKEPLLFNIAKDKHTTLATLKRDLKALDSEAGRFKLISGELNALNGNYKDLIQTLYKNLPYPVNRYVKCSSIFSKSNSKCLRPAEIVVELKEPKKVDNVERNIEQNRERYDRIVKDMIGHKFENLAQIMERMELIVRNLLSSRTATSDSSDIGIQFFYDVIKNMNENIMTFPACKESFSNLLKELGIFVEESQETEGTKILDLALKRPELLEILSNIFVPSRTGPEYFINMYKFLIDSHMKRCDTKILFVMFSKFDLLSWLQTNRPKLAEISRLLRLIITGLENWNQPESNLIQDLFRCHIIHIFEHEFPEHYGEVLQVVLNEISEQKLMSIVLLDLLNSLLLRFGCEPLNLDSKREQIRETATQFATRQNLFNFKGAKETLSLFTRHFQNERLHHGLHGLYPKHVNYCHPLSAWFTCFGHVVVVTAICAYPGVLADQISDWIFECVVDMFSPWLVAYTGQNLQQTTANWIRQLIQTGKVLYPWTAPHSDIAKLIINSFIDCIQFNLESLPVSQSVLGHTFGWYLHHFAVADMGQHIRTPIHKALVELPWERFKPEPQHIKLFYDRLHEYLPESHAFLGHIFLRIDWNDWIQQTFAGWQASVRTQVISLLLTVFVQMPFEPHLHENPNTSSILEDAIKFPWHMVQYQGLENIFKWVLVSVEPSIVLKLQSESNYADRAVLDLLKFSSSMTLTPSVYTADIQAKRILYTRSIVRLLRSCAAKHPKLVETKEGLKSYRNAIVELLDTIERLIVTPEKSRDEQETEAQNLLIEIIGSVESQSEYTSKLFIDAIIFWQSKCNIGSPVMTRTLNAIGSCKTFINGIYGLIEVSIFNYFRFSEEVKEYHSPSWQSVVQTLQPSVNKIEMLPLLRGQHLLALHAYILCKIQTYSTVGEKITFLQDLSQLLENVKTNGNAESRIVIVWGVIISCGCQILAESENAKKPLLMLARYFQVISTQTEGWGEGLLGVIGLKKDGVSNKRKVLTRCLSCIIFSLFPDESCSPPQANQEFLRSLAEMKTLWNNKKYSDVQILLTKAIEIINGSFFLQVHEVPERIYKIVELFYQDSFLRSIPEVWQLQKCP